MKEGDETIGRRVENWTSDHGEIVVDGRQEAEALRGIDHPVIGSMRLMEDDELDLGELA